MKEIKLSNLRYNRTIWSN